MNIVIWSPIVVPRLIRVSWENFNGVVGHSEPHNIGLKTSPS